MTTTNTHGQVAEGRTVNANSLLEAIEHSYKTGVPVMVWGAPGVGKSAVSYKAASRNGWQIHDVRTTLIDPIDLRGIPWRDELTTFYNGNGDVEAAKAEHNEIEAQKKQSITRWAPPDFLPWTDEPHLIVLDELPSAMPSVQVALYQLVYDRRIGEYKMPPGAALMAAGNRISDRGVAHKMPTPLASRLTHLTLEPDNKTWLDWAVTEGNIEPQVVAYINLFPESLHVFDPTSDELPFACPRTWEMVSKTIAEEPHMSLTTLAAMICGTIGNTIGTAFIAFMEQYKYLPDPMDIINDPENSPIPQRNDILLALINALYQYATDTNFDAILKYAQRLDEENAMALVRNTTKRKPELMKTTAYINWAALHTTA